MTYKRYDEYKDSVSEFIEDIPLGWKVVDIKYLLSNEKYSIKSGPFGSQLKNDDMVNGSFKVYNQRNVLDNDFSIGDYYIEKDKFKELKAFKVEYGDILITTRGTIGRVAIVPKRFEEGVLHPCLIKIKLNKEHILNEYVEKIFNYTNIIFNQVNKLSNSTTIEVIYTDTLKNICIPVPSLYEQEKIVNFLDKKTSEIDKLIEEKEKLIELLKEKREAIITEAVTKGLDKNVKMKDSGVEWIGEIPKHWKVALFKRIITGIKDGTHGTHKRVDEGELLLSAKNVFDNGIIFDDSDSKIDINEYKQIVSNGYPKKGDILISTVGSIGRSFVYDFDFPIAFQRSVTFIRLKENYIPEFYKYFIESKLYQEQLLSFAKTSAQSGVYMGDILKTFVILIPKEEQKLILNFIEEKIKNIDCLIESILKEIENINDYKKALISEVVTGKIDVRNEV